MLVLAFGSILGANAQTLTVTDNDVLNFALQAECLAAAFWNAAATGTNLTAAQLGRLPLLAAPYMSLCPGISCPDISILSGTRLKHKHACRFWQKVQ